MSKSKVLNSYFTICITGTLSFAAEKVYFYHTDPAGTPLAMTDSSGNVVWKADYKPFGEENSTSGSAANDRRFVGKEKDEETGLSYFGARYENAKIGRFIAPDPVRAVDPRSSKTNEQLLLNPQRLNTYAYGLNNPYRYVDPDGKFVFLIPAIIAGAEYTAGWMLGDMIFAYAAGQVAQNIYKDSNAKGNSSVEPGSRQKNRIPDNGEPDTVGWNKPGTTGKKYGKDGMVEKELNKGHQGTNVPEVERDDHIHDHKPNPHHPNGQPTREPGRAPTAQDYKDFKK
jgi:RHS repeat-associated protein